MLIPMYVRSATEQLQNKQVVRTGISRIGVQDLPNNRLPDVRRRWQPLQTAHDDVTETKVGKLAVSAVRGDVTDD